MVEDNIVQHLQPQYPTTEHVFEHACSACSEMLTLTEAELDVRQFHILFSVQVRGNYFKRDE